jgi:thiol-disulfide isomerase/thioredoxin
MRALFFLLHLLLITAPLQAAEIVHLVRPEPAPDIVFQDSEGRPRKLSDYRGRPVLLNFWATWCLPCVTELPSLDRLAGEMGDRGPAIIALSLDRKGIPAVRHFFEKNGIRHLEALVDQTRESSALMGAAALPTTLFLDAEGREIAQRLTGAIDWNDPAIRASLNRLLGKETKP